MLHDAFPRRQHVCFIASPAALAIREYFFFCLSGFFNVMQKQYCVCATKTDALNFTYHQMS